MKSKIPLTWSVIILVVVGIILFLTIFFFAKDFSVNPILPAGNLISQASQQASVGFPTRLVIPKINVDTPIEYVGLTPQGAMAVPAGPIDVAWFDLGPRPGEVGSAVIAGHEGWKDGIWAVFDDLYKLRVGDKLYVEDAQNAATSFVVTGIQTYDQNGDVSDVFSSNDGKAHLNLITCEGVWNATEKSYSNRLVVFTDKET